MISKRRYLFSTVLLVAAWATVSTPGSNATEFRGEVLQDDVLLTDTELVAKARGISASEAKSMRATADKLGDVAVQVAVAQPEAFVGSDLAPETGAGPTLYIAGAADASVRELAREAGITVVDNQPFSFDELELRKREVHDALAKLGFQNFSNSFDIADGRWIRSTISRSDAGSRSADEILQMVPEALRDRIQLQIVEGAGEDLDAFGGMAARNNGVTWCTTGWSVYHLASDTPGVLSAGHCSGIDHILHVGD